MNTILITVLSAAALMPSAPPAAPVPVAPEADLPLTGKILVLTNQLTVEGDVEYIGDQYRVCRAVGEAWIPGNKVLRLCADKNEAYAFLHVYLKVDDSEGRLRLAEWCLDHGMNREALAETRAVLARDSRSAKGLRIQARLEPQPGTGAREPSPPPVLPTPPPAPRLDLTAEALIQFGNRIQPILMNACASCHNETRGTAFRLIRTYEIGVGNRTTLQQNVSAVLAYVQIDQPPASPFLTKAIGVHWWKQTPEGMQLAAGDPSQPPFQNRNAPAFRALEDWVRLAVTTSPQFVQIQVAAPTPEPMPAQAPRSVPVVPSKPETPATEATTLPHRDDTVPTPVQAVPQPSAAAPSSASPGVCDPDEFNRVNHPARGTPNEAPPK